MAIKIGHASCDENGRIVGGKAGDQTKKELCIRDWYNKGWNVLLRPKSATLAEKSAKACEQACANECVGYDQYQRNTLYVQADAVDFNIARIKVNCETDCSALMHVCALAGGARINYGSNGATTRTMRNKFASSGEYDVLTGSKYLTSDKYLKRGDILVKEGSHTVMVLENGSGLEKTKSVAIDGEWGTATTSRMQKIFGTTVDGIVSSQTVGCAGYQKNCLTSSWKYSGSGRGSDLIRAMQKKLKTLGYYTSSIDGLCGRNTIMAIQKWMNALGYNAGAVDGIMGAKTVMAIQKWANAQ